MMFSPEFRRQHTATLSGTVVLLLTALPLLAVYVFYPMRLLWAPAVVLALAIFWLSMNFLMPWNFKALERDFVAWDKAIPHHEGQSFLVGLSPGSEPLTYDNFMEWDMGWLLLSPTHLCYVGELTRFAIPRQAVQSVEQAPGHPGWYRSILAVVRYRRSDGMVGTFNLLRTDIGSMLEQGHKTRALAERLSAWRASGAHCCELPADIEHMPPPEWGQVQGKPSTASPGTLLATMATFGFPPAVLERLLSQHAADSLERMLAAGALGALLAAWTLLPGLFRRGGNF